MGKRVADQHAVMDRGWAVADDLADAIEAALPWSTPPIHDDLLVALRRYEEARNG